MFSRPNQEKKVMAWFARLYIYTCTDDMQTIHSVAITHFSGVVENLDNLTYILELHRHDTVCTFVLKCHDGDGEKSISNDSENNSHAGKISLIYVFNSCMGNVVAKGFFNKVCNF